MIGGAVVVGAALITEVKYQPPYWVHAALWLPLILIVTLLAVAGAQEPPHLAAVSPQGFAGDTCPARRRIAPDVGLNV
jgi:hypothetical protein